MKLALLQCDVKDGDLTGNAARIRDMARKLEHIDLCVIPMGALSGPQAAQAREPGFGLAIRACLDNLAREMANAPVLLGHEPTVGYFLLEKGQWREIDRIFSFRGLKLGMELRPEDAERLDIGIAMRPRPFNAAALGEWELILSGFCRQGALWGVSVNLCGGYGSQVYAGESMAMGPDGMLAAKAKSFAEDCLLLDTDWLPGEGRIETGPASPQEALWLALTLGLKDFVGKIGNPDVLLGLSGGIDSALVACVAASALGSSKVTAVLMPSPYTSRESVEDASQLAANLGIRMRQIPITPMLESFRSSLAPELALLRQARGEASAENLQARIRGVILMTLANYSGALVLNCSNKSEAAMGYCTLYGDTAGAVAVIGDLLKTQVYELASWLRGRPDGPVIPERILAREPSAELRPGQKDTDTLPPYAELDPLLARLLGAEASEDASLAELAARVAGFAYKRRQSPPALLVSGLPLDLFPIENR